MTKHEKLKLEREVKVEWSYPAIPKPVYACRMYHPSGAYIHTNSYDQRRGYEWALHLIAKQLGLC